MTGVELKQLRHFLCMTTREAAIFVGELEGQRPERSWQRWEDGSREIPLYVKQTMQMLALTRIEMLQVEFDAASPQYTYFANFDDYKAAGGAGNELKWKLAQSASLQIVCEREANCSGSQT